MALNVNGAGAMERAWLVAFASTRRSSLSGARQRRLLEEHLEELARLAESAGAQVTGQSCQERPQADPSTLVGKGFLMNLKETLAKNAIDVVIFDNELTPSQNRNLEKFLDCKVLDRTSLILDIFAGRARTREGKIQVELAQMQYLYPRLVGRWMHFSRQEGGIGMRGPGETQLEVDRRIVKERIQALSAKLERVKAERMVRKDRRMESQLPLISLVGYTNAGKSSLLNAFLSRSGRFAAKEGQATPEYTDDRHFATLDPVTRRVHLDQHLVVLMSDTVGFVQKLPHELVASFRSTFEEIRDSDLLLHVMDLHHPQKEEQANEVLRVLREMETDHIPMVNVLNKVDLCPEIGAREAMGPNGKATAFVSATEGKGLSHLIEVIMEALNPLFPCVNLVLPSWEGRVRARLYARGTVLAEKTGEEGIEMRVRLPKDLLQEVKAFVV